MSDLRADIDILETSLDEIRRLLKVEPSGVAGRVLEAARQWADLMDDVREAVKGKTGNAILMTANEIGKHLGVTEEEE